MQITLPDNFDKCSVYELCAYHDYYNRNGGFYREEYCTRIENHMKDMGWHHWAKINFKYYKPIAEMQVKMFNNT